MAMCEQGFSLFKRSGDGPVIGRVTEVTARRKDGKEIPVEVSAAPLRVGDEWHAVGVVRDITERKQAEQDLHESEAKYRRVVENSLVGFGIIQDNMIRFANEKWCETFGYGYEEAIDRLSPLDVVHPDDRELVSEHIRKRVTGELNRRLP
jgi:PAS domain-containing protein